jgi:hypothetical protein
MEIKQVTDTTPEIARHSQQQNREASESKKKQPKRAKNSVSLEKVELSKSSLKRAEEPDPGKKKVLKGNDPKSYVTKEKLRKILKTGAFNFSGREKQILAKILKK